ncbi:acyltransferase family protein [Parabacteroides sp. FAFU027]|uniref:acyltransferase family protein n=1 Tax=Parabacteroides sp. FAFU027 TaxID=2922715 RepID=UPI001FAEF71F|nr:acyltransferase [Parabacteroides sp. FAFU027]
MKQRNELIDVIKGFAILLVVLGHAVQYNVKAFDQHILFRVIYSFHMPLFMFISGFVACGTFDGSFQVLRKRFNSLIIPFFSWLAITDLLGLLFNYLHYQDPIISYHSPIAVILSPSNGGLWFLWILFQNYLILFLALRIKFIREEWCILLLGILIFVLSEYFRKIPVIHGLRNSGWYLIFFSLGYMLNRYKEQTLPFLRKTFPLILLLFVLTVSVWYRAKTPKVIFSFPLYLRSYIYYIYLFLVPITGVFSVWFILEKMIQIKLLKLLFSQLGVISLAIYAIHYYFISLGIAIFQFHVDLKIYIVSIFALTAAIFTQKLLAKSKLLAFLLLGRKLAKSNH